MIKRHGSPEGYVALDGEWVEIPPPPVLRADPPGRFGPQDYTMLDELIADRDRALEREFVQFQPDTSTGMPEGIELSPEEQAFFKAAQERNLAISKETFAQLERGKKASERQFGADGRKFIDALNDGSAINNFWQALQLLFCTRLSLLECHAPTQHKIVGEILLRIPERDRIRLLAEQFFPDLKPRKSDPLAQLFAEYLHGPKSDFRHLEWGAPKPQSETDLPTDTKNAVAMHFGELREAFLAFKGSAIDLNGSDDLDIMAHGQKTADLLRGRKPEPGDLVGVGTLSQVESGWMKQAAYSHAMSSVARGRPEGHYLRLALQKRPSGFRTMRLDTFPRRSVWPYIASHLDILDRALGLTPCFTFDPKFERVKALNLLRLLPKVPARYADVLIESATSGHRTEAEAAQACLAGMGHLAEKIIPLLSVKRAKTRIGAARCLAIVGNENVVQELYIRLDKEKSSPVAGAIREAISVLSSSAKPLSAPDSAVLMREARVNSEKQWPTKTGWMADIQLPVLVFKDGGAAPAGVGIWLLKLALEAGRPSIAGNVDIWMPLFTVETQRSFALEVVRQWTAFDAAPQPEERLERWRQTAIDEGYNCYLMFREHHFDDIKMSARLNWFGSQYEGEEPDRPKTREEWARANEESWRHRAQTFANWEKYPNSAAAARGALAFARYALPGPLLSNIAEYLEAHGRRTNQAKSLLEVLAALPDGSGLELLRSISRHQPQKTLRSYADMLLHEAEQQT